MITVIAKEQSLHIGSCNSCCDKKAVAEIKFKSAYSNGGIVVALCGDCIKQAQAVLNAIELPKEAQDG